MINLRTETVSERFRAALSPQGYLVPGNAPQSGGERARGLVELGLDVVADNGNFDDIGRIARALAPRAARLHEKVQARARALGRGVREGELAPELRDAYRALAAQARSQSRDATSEREAVLARQRAFAPTKLIGAEDITMAVWLALNIEPGYVQLPRRDYKRINQAVARAAAHEQEALSPQLARGYYAVASAVDHDSALDAGRVFAAAGLQRVAMGFGAYMADDNYSDCVRIDGRRLELPRRMANRYLRTALVARGFWTGYREVAGAAPRAFHFLGLGAPIMMALVALAGWDTPLLTYDATSPVRDAVEGTMYLTRPAPLKVRTRHLALQLVSGARTAWACPCPFCAAFVAQHPFDLDAGRAWFAAHPGQEPAAADLRPGGALFRALPLLAEPAGGELRRAVSFARMGHNHWALRETTRHLNASSGRRARLDAHVRGLVQRYERATNSPAFAAAVRFGYELAAGAFPAR